MYEIQPLLPQGIKDWDSVIAPYPNRELFHRATWLQYLATTRGVAIRHWEISENGRRVGYFPAGILNKGPFRVLGSPLKGWGSSVMGPVVGEEFDPAAFLDALDTLASEEGISMLEIESPLLKDDLMQARGYDSVINKTLVVELTPENPEIMWKRIQSTTRNEIRRSQKYGVVVEDSDDPQIARILYDGWVEILKRKQLAPAYEFSWVKLMFEHLKPRGLMFALCVRDSHGTPIATGFFPHDDRTAYFALTGNRKEYFKLYPNDLMHWTLMTKAAQLGIRRYDMYGYGPYKAKFGGELKLSKRWHKCYNRTAQVARWSYERYFDTRLWARGLWNRRVVRS